MEFKKEKCPYCGTECEADWVDADVTWYQCGPYNCEKCGASEIGRFDSIGFEYGEYFKWQEENFKYIEDRNGDLKHVFIGEGSDKFIIPDTATITQDEWNKGWYKPNSPMGSSVNTCNGEYVHHEEAEKLYKMGLLDEKGNM